MPFMAASAAIGAADIGMLGLAGGALAALWRRNIVLEDRNREDYRAAIEAIRELTAAVREWHASHEAEHVA